MSYGVGLCYCVHMKFPDISELTPERAQRVVLVEMHPTYLSCLLFQCADSYFLYNHKQFGWFGDDGTLFENYIAPNVVSGLIEAGYEVYLSDEVEEFLYGLFAEAYVPCPLLRSTTKLKMFQNYGVKYLLQHPRGLGVWDTGTGKTLLGITMAAERLHRGEIDLVVVWAQSGSILKGWGERFTQFSTLTTERMDRGTPAKREKAYKESTAQVLLVNYAKARCSDYDFILSHAKGKRVMFIFDECFVAGTKVNTPSGMRNIEDIEVGDTVLNAFGAARVREVSSRISPSTVALYLSNGSRVECTPDHKFFTSNGWIPAHALEGEVVLTWGDDYADGTETVRGVRQGLLRRSIPATQATVLRDELFREVEDAATRDKGACIFGRGGDEDFFSPQGSASSKSATGGEYECSNEGSQSIPQSRDGGEAGQFSFWQRFRVARWWKRTRSNRTAEDATGGAWRRLGRRICNRNWGMGWGCSVPSMLQGGLGAASGDGLGGSRWSQSQSQGVQSARQEEGVQVVGTRVERVEVLECGDSERSGGGRPEGKGVRVYNIGVEGHPSYFVEGLLVHNCQKLKNRKTATHKFMVKLAKEAKVGYLLGLSATPVERGPEDWYNVFRVLDASIYKRVQDFEAAYTYEFGAQDMFHNYIGFQNLQDMRFKTSFMVSTARKSMPEIAIEFPHMDEFAIPLELSPEDTKVYKVVSEMAKKDLGALSEDGGQVLTRQAQWADALRRVCSLPETLLLMENLPDMVEAVRGMAGVADSKYCVKLTETLDKVRSIISQGSKVIVFYSLTNHGIIPLAPHFKEFNPILYHGGMSGQAREDAEELFKTSKTRNLFIVSDAGREGLNLPQAGYVIHYNTPYMWTWYRQRSDRAHRIDSLLDNVTIYRWITDSPNIPKGTIEPRIESTMWARKAYSDEVGVSDDAIPPIGRFDERFILFGEE